MTQLREAIVALIEAATGGGDPSQYILISQARARLPIFPDVQNVDGRIVVTAPTTGTVRIPGGVSFLHRGIFPVTTVQTDFTTVASKIYHLRWNPTTGYALIDLADAGYNPSTLPEIDGLFDTVYDNMLIARIITNSANIATITNLANKDRLFRREEQTGSAINLNWPNTQAWAFDRTATIAWSRTPQIAAIEGSISAAFPVDVNGIDGGANVIRDRTVTRYGVSGGIFTDWGRNDNMTGVQGRLFFQLAA